MLPGATRSIKKMTTDIPNRVSSIRPKRRTRYAAKASSHTCRALAAPPQSRLTKA